MSNDYCLLVDDDKFFTDLFAPLMQARGYNPISVHSGREALRKIELSAPLFVVLDINLPDISGFEVLRAIRSKEGNAEILVFMLTGRTEATAQLASFNIGATEFFSKTASPRKIIQQIQDVLWSRQL